MRNLLVNALNLEQRTFVDETAWRQGILYCIERNQFVFFSFSSIILGLVPKPSCQVSQARETASEGFGSIGDTLLQWNDAEYPRLQCVKGISAVSSSEFDKSISAGKIQPVAQPRTLCWHLGISLHSRIYFKWVPQPIREWPNHSRWVTLQTWARSAFDKIQWVSQSCYERLSSYKSVAILKIISSTNFLDSFERNFLEMLIRLEFNKYSTIRNGIQSAHIHENPYMNN